MVIQLGDESVKATQGTYIYTWNLPDYEDGIDVRVENSGAYDGGRNVVNGTLFGYEVVFFRFLLADEDATMFDTAQLPLSPDYALEADFQQTELVLFNPATGESTALFIGEFPGTRYPAGGKDAVLSGTGDEGQQVNETRRPVRFRLQSQSLTGRSHHAPRDEPLARRRPPLGAHHAERDGYIGLVPALGLRAGDAAVSFIRRPQGDNHVATLTPGLCRPAAGGRPAARRIISRSGRQTTAAAAVGLHLH
jgi:hypothetical protein